MRHLQERVRLGGVRARERLGLRVPREGREAQACAAVRAVAGGDGAVADLAVGRDGAALLDAVDEVGLVRVPVRRGADADVGVLEVALLVPLS